MDYPSQKPAFPTVVQVEGDVIDWWRPNRSGVDATDYALGKEAFRDAQWHAAQNQAFGLICSFVLGMRDPQAFELGFLDAYALAAAACKAPCLYTAAHMREQSNEILSFDAINAGNQEAWRDRQRASTCGIGPIVRNLLKFVMGVPDPSLPAYVHSLSVAAVRATLIAN